MFLTYFQAQFIPLTAFSALSRRKFVAEYLFLMNKKNLKTTYLEKL